MKVFEVVEAPKKNPGVVAMMKEVWANTEGHPFVRGMRITKELVGMEVKNYWDTEVHIGSIMSFEKKNAGNASKALKWLCDLADKHKVLLTLSVKPLKNAGAKEGKNLSKNDLIAWYARNGFVRKGKTDHMSREPR
jgi:allophanate hydrolase subunit 2